MNPIKATLYGEQVMVLDVSRQPWDFEDLDKTRKVYHEPSAIVLYLTGYKKGQIDVVSASYVHVHDPALSALGESEEAP